MVDSTPEGDQGGPDGPPAVDLHPTGGPVLGRGLLRRRPAVALWGVLAVLALGAGVLVVQSGDDDPPRLPIALGSSAGTEKRAAPASSTGLTADMALAPWITYVAGDDLPALGGTGAAYRPGGEVGADAVQSLARALGLTGAPTRVDGGWHLESAQGVLDVSASDGGSWWFSSTPADAGSSASAEGSSGEGSSGSSGAGVSSPPDLPVTVTTIPADATVAAKPAPNDASTSIASPPTCGGGEPTTTTSAAPCVVVDPVPPVTVPVDLPSKAEARRIALDLLSATGMDVRDATVTVDGPDDAWYVSVEPRIDGLAASGLTASVSVGSKGAIGYASGFLDHPARLGDYPLLDTRAAIDRLNAQGLGGSILDDRAAAATDVAPPPTVVAPMPTTTVVGSAASASESVVMCETPPPAADGTPATEACIGDPGIDGPTSPPEPQRVVLHRAERVLILVPANDTSGDVYLVPGYRFTGDDEVVVEAVAVDDDSLVPPTPDPTRVIPTDPNEVTSTVDLPVAPQPAIAPAVGEQK